ncbi:MAG: Integrase/recombinase, XerD/RipX family [Acidobacteriaceae bacterium]|nr:Integrase/recombinase, XerD/RipX family [Acidobacteriaceae bacterium]
MLMEEVFRLFIRSREMGTKSSGARKKARPRTIECYKWDLNHFFSFMAERSLTRWHDMKRADVVDFLAWLGNKGWADSSKSKVLRSLRALFRWVERDEDCQDEQLKTFHRLLPAIEQNRLPTVLPSPKEIKKVLGSFNVRTRAGLRDYVALSLMLDTGLRSGELRFLKLHHLHLEEGWILAPREGKTGERMVPISHAAKRILRGWLRHREKFASDDWVFVNHHGRQMGRFTLDHSFRKTWGKLNIPRLNPHMARHIFCTYYLKNGGDIAKLKTITGHSSYQILDHYVHLAEVGSQEMREEQERVSPLKSVNRE